MKMLTTLAAGAAMAFTAIPFASPAMAQGTMEPITRHEGNGTCPTGWYAGGGTQRESKLKCYPSSQASPAYYNPEAKPCAPNYRSGGGKSYYCWEKSGVQADDRSAADKLVSYGTLAKANRLDRCPLGYFSKADMTICTTRLSPAPKSRKKTGACNSNEIDEWGLYCTADANVITREQAEQEANRDFNAIYTANGANYPAQGNDTENYPSMVAAYGPKGGGGSASGSSSGDSQTAQDSGCANGSATGAAIGGAMAGEGGAVLGSMLGGLGKKKKKKGC